MKMELPEIPAGERTPLVESLLAIVHQLVDRVNKLEEVVRQQADEIARLKGLSPRPEIRPSILESNKNSSGGQKDTKPKRPPRGPTKNKLTIHREVPVHIEEHDLPEGASFKQYEEYVVQELLIRTENTKYLRARYQLPDGRSLLAPFPAGVLPVEGGHFGPNLVSHILDQYHQAQVTEPLLLEQLHEYGIQISAGQLHIILTERKDIFHQEKAEILATGLMVSAYIATDDTGARHQGHNGYCTVVTNDLFAYFESTDSKSRLNFLQVLQGNQRDYVINEMAVAHWERQGLAKDLLTRLNQGPLEFSDTAAWQAHLKERDITSERHMRITTEGALLGGLVARGVSPGLGVLSDGAGQFVVFVHAACWIHAERPLAKLVPHNEEHRAAIEKVRGQIWELYKDLKAYRQQPDQAVRSSLKARFDALVEQRTVYPSINGPLKEMCEHKTDLLRILDRPEIPLHNNVSESDIREYVKRRKISGGTRSDAGRRCRDTFASLKKTCRKLGLRFWDYLQDRVRGLGQIPRLADLIRRKAEEFDAKNVQTEPT
jgi:transposase IS66 family protein